ncbi:MAG: hypothetical protein R8J84_07635 [Mariprofundales bacterium]
MLIQTGDPDRAISEARHNLAKGNVNNNERFQLLALISDAEFIRATAQFFNEIDTAVTAQEAVLKAFPERSDGARLRWRIVKLYWKHGQIDAALVATQKLRSIFPSSIEAHQSWMVDAQLKLKLGRTSQARSALLQFSLQAKGTKEQALLLAWTGMVDNREQRYLQALKSFDRSSSINPTAIEGSPLLYSTYIMIQHRQGKDQKALMLSNRFLTRYLDSDLIPSVRLTRTDILAQLPKAHALEVEREYTFLSEHHTGSTISKQAFMRKMMFQVRNKDDFFSFKPVLVALKKLARVNQMSVIEDEAMLDQAILWARLANSKAKDAPPGSIDAALENFSRASDSSTPAVRQKALDNGSAVFDHYIKKMIDQKKHLQMVALWKRYPAIRIKSSDDVRFGVARAMRLLTQYDQAEQLLKKLYQRNQSTLRGQRVMLELARLWLDRGDASGIDNINRWLSEHEFTIYRPEMLLLVAQMQLDAKRLDAAAQSIRRVSANDLVRDLQPEYWKSRAHIAEARQRWHVAAHAWHEFGKSNEDNHKLALRRQALALYKAEDYAAAEQQWQKIPKDAHDAAWNYYLNMSRFHNGQWEPALKALRALTQDQTAGLYATLAEMALAEHDANQLLKQRP